MTSKRIQAVLSDRLAKKVKQEVETEGFGNVSEFYRHLTEEYFIRKQYGLIEVKNPWKSLLRW